MKKRYRIKADPTVFGVCEGGVTDTHSVILAESYTTKIAAKRDIIERAQRYGDRFGLVVDPWCMPITIDYFPEGVRLIKPEDVKLTAGDRRSCVHVHVEQFEPENPPTERVDTVSDIR